MKKTRRIYLLTALLGGAAGMLNALLGTGGGVLLVLGLRRICRGGAADQRGIYAGASAVTLPRSLFTLARYHWAGHLPSGALRSLLLPAVLGGALGALILPHVGVRTLRRLFSGITLLSGVLMLLR